MDKLVAENFFASPPSVSVEPNNIDKINALRLQKQKFLAALTKTKLSLTEDDDKLTESVFTPKTSRSNVNVSTLRKIRFRMPMVLPGWKKGPSVHWIDSIATKRFKQHIAKNHHFDLRLYLDCAKMIFLAFSGKLLNHSNNIYEAFTYVLTHARCFGDPAKNIFHLEGDADASITFNFNEEKLTRFLPDSVYMRKVTGLINDLRVTYDEDKYVMLNVNVTYLTLLILRRSARNETQFKDSFKHYKTHSDYVSLCPYPLHEKMVLVSDVFNKNMTSSRVEPAVILAIHAFLNVNDELTKKALRVTCIQYLEWNGLHLPHLFFKVTQLYNIEEAVLWDSLCHYKEARMSLYKLSRDYYEQFLKFVGEPSESAVWFPYCRALSGDYHSDLSAAENETVCLLLAYLVDMNIGLKLSFMRNAHWTKKINQLRKDQILAVAQQLSKEYPFA